jgi:O-antigen/teichoic acid export membrane protein
VIDTRAAERWPSLRRARRWGARGFWTIADQGLISLSNFLLNVLLARWLSADAYGAFTVGFSILLIVGSFHGALLTDPMLVFGASRFTETASAYLRALIFGHWVLTLPVALVALGSGLGLRFLDAGALSPALLGLAVATPLYLLLLLLRRACYVRMDPRRSAVASGLYLVVTLLAAFAASRMTELSSESGFLALAAGSLASSGWLLSRLGIAWSFPSRAEISEIVSVHWKFSRWALGTNLAQWVRGNLYFFILPIWGGLEANAAFRALANLIMPLTQPLVAISPLLLPAFVKARARPDFGVTVGRVAILLTAGAAAYWLGLGLFNQAILDWLYGGKYLEYGHLAWVIGLIPVCVAAGGTVATALRALERPDRDFWVTAVSAAITLTIGVLLTRAWGVAGAILGSTLSFVVALALLVAIFLSLRSERHRGTR